MGLFYNQTDHIGVLIDAFTNNITGSLFLTLLIIALILMAFCFLFRIPLEFSSALVLPIYLASWSHSADFTAVGGALLIYMGVIFAKMLFIR